MIGEILKDTPVSTYAPSLEVRDFTFLVKKDCELGWELLNRSWMELNNCTIMQDKENGQKMFNAFVDENVEDPAEAWKWRGTRSKARNKAIQMHAQITAGYIVPSFMAQNEKDEMDLDFSDFMQDIVEWMINNSEYKTSFLQITMGMLMNPVTYLGAEYKEIYQTIREKTARGYKKTEILDEVLSGFAAPVYSAEQVLISNAYEQNIQKQRFIIKRRYIDISEARDQWEDHENWDYVRPGIKSIYNETDGQFYDIYDDQHPNLVAEEIYLNRAEDTEVCFLNGIYMGVANVENNPIKHRTPRNAPKYNIEPFGYQRINEHFFYYKSLMNAMQWDDKLIDAQYELGMNRAFLDTNMPVAISGINKDDKIDSDVVFPSSVIAFKDPNAKVVPILPKADLGGLFNAMKITEESMEEASVSETMGGHLPEAQQKATSVVLAERHAKTILRGVGKTLAESIVHYGDLMADIVVNNLSVAEIEEMIGGGMKMKYRTFILKDKMVNGKRMSKTLKFDKSLLGLELTEKEKEKRNLELLKEVGYPNNKTHLYLINPELFAKMKYLTKVEPETMFPKNEEFMQAIASQLYAQLRNDPYVSAEALVRKTLYAYYRDEADDLMVKQPMAGIPGLEGGKPEQTQFGQMGQNIVTGKALARV